MRKAIVSLISLMLVAIGSQTKATGQRARVAVVSPEPLAGTWTNTDLSGKGILKLIISASSSGISVEGFGACHPSPCVWGSVPGIVYADKVTSNSAVGFSARFDSKLGKKIVLGHLRDQYLDVEVLTEFTDGSGRSNLYLAAEMAR